MKSNLFFPIFKNLEANTLLKAFILNALIIAFISVLTIEFRLFLQTQTRKTDYFYIPSERTKLLYSFFISFLVALICYLLFLVLFGWGGGLIATSWNKLNLY